MKIIRAHVDDPRKRGEYKNPRLNVEVDEQLRETGETIDYHMWQVTPHGPFMAVDYRTDFDKAINGQVWETGDLGEFNKTNFHTERLVDVTVLDPHDEIDLAMGLDRARRTLRKFNLPWRFVLDDIAGQHGMLQWRLVEQVPHCVRCGARAVEDIYYRRTHLSLCERDLANHNKHVRKLRVNS